MAEPGGLDVLVTVAGAQRPRPAAEFTDEDLDVELQVALRPPVAWQILPRAC